jgi:rubrerythrin
LVEIKGGKQLRLAGQELEDLKIVDYLVATEPSSGMDYRDALILAMKQEKAAFKLYSDLAAVSEDLQIREIFLGLAQEEAKHKLRFELEYDETIQSAN